MRTIEAAGINNRVWNCGRRSRVFESNFAGYLGRGRSWEVDPLQRLKAGTSWPGRRERERERMLGPECFGGEI